MRAEEIMTRSPRTVTPDQTVAEAVRVMASEGCGIVPVVASGDASNIIGVVTDRDVALRACAPNGQGPHESISAVMTSNVFCVSPDDELARVTEVMESAGIRRVPVVGENNKLLGIISIADVARNADDSRVGELESQITELAPNN